MNYLQNKRKRRFGAAARITLWLALLVLVFFNKSYGLLQNAAVKTAMFLLPERSALLESLNNIVYLEQLGALRQENQKLKEALGARGAGKNSFIPAMVRFGGDYLFVDSFFLSEGMASGIRENSIVLTQNDILVGRVVAAGGGWSKVEKTGSLGQKLALFSPDYNLSFEAVGIGGGELLAELPEQVGSLFKPGDIVRSAENPDYIVGVVDGVDFTESNPFGKVFIVAGAAPAPAWVKVILNND